ncbi:MAG: S-layer homology domain-containing protein [Syntrophomonas sp.]
MNLKTRLSSRPKRSKFLRQCLSLVLAVALMVAVVPVFPNTGWQALAADELTGNTVQPVVVVSGTGVLGGNVYSTDNVGYEKSYTMDELKAIASADSNAATGNRYLYSAYNTYNTASMYLGEGVRLDTLLAKSGVTSEAFSTNLISLAAPDNYSVKYDPAKTTVGETSGASRTQNFGVPRYYYPNLVSDGAGNEDNPVQVATILAWAQGGDKGSTEIPTTVTDLDKLESMTGQIALNDYNNPLFNGDVTKILVGDSVTETVITIDGVAKTRSEILMMERADRSYTYSSSGGDKTDFVRGVPLSVLLSAYNDADTVKFTTADDYPVGGFSLTVGELKNGNYILAYEKGTSVNDLTGIYATAKDNASIYGYFTLYGDGVKPSKLINNITVTPSSGIDFVNSIYKHITNGGLTGQTGPYGIDAITGATLTVEGPGVTSSVPLPIRELEGQNAGAYRGTYTDTRGGVSWTQQYEGISLSYIINNMTSGDNGIHKTSNAYKVLLKNRVRQTIAEFTLNDIANAETAGKPIIIAYGTGTTDDATAAPFVYDGAAGYKDALDNDDGPIKLVYDKSAFATDPNPGYTEFGNVAYIYVAEQSSPGYKHAIAPFNTAENSQYVLTVTGDKIGREVNYTVDQLEKMVTYDANDAPEAGGMGYRDEYSLANSSYWYVNQYEGVQLWKLLQKSGLAAATATGADKDTLVSFSATDNYKDFDKFTIEQISNPDLFGYYEKNPADLNDGNYVSVATDLKSTGYPVLVAYGVNSYPYVIKNTLDGYMSGLSNDGGPLRIISGKTQYNHANGSKQAKLLDKIIVGQDNYYSTHKYNPNCNGVYQQIANNSALSVKVISGASADGTVLKDLTYKIGDLEELLYGGSLTTAQLKEAKVKGFYEAFKNGSFYNDLYEGMNLSYFLENVVQLPGYKGTITFSDGTNNLSMSLEEALDFSGYNGTTKLGGLSPVIAYAKNGSPMVNSKNTVDGYENTVVLAQGTPYEQTITVKNNGGPLAVLFPRETADAATADSLNSITSITINLSADNYAHTETPYSTLANNTITVSGAGTRLTTAKSFKVSDIEGKQTLAVTGDYNVKNSTGSQSQTRYRGIPLYDFLNSTDVGLKPNADKVIVTCSDSTSYEFNLSDVYKSDYINGQNPAVNNLKMILAYGSAAVTNPDSEDGKPLVQVKTAEAGYDEAYGNSGGPIRLVVGQTDANDINSGKILKDVTSIEVTASDMVSWNHSSSAIYQQYLNKPFKLQVVDSSNNTLLDKDYTLEQIESMTSMVERENITWVGTQEWEGINLWDFALQEASSISGIADPTSITAYASDGFNKELRSIFGMDALENGIKDGEARIPIILGYAVNGYPLVTDANSDGYTGLVDNDGGPIRLMTHGNQGACLSDTVKLVVKVGASGTDPQPVTEKDFNIYGLKSGTVAMDIRAIKNITSGDGKTVADYTWKGNTDKVKGAYLSDILKEAGVAGSGVKVDLTTTDGFAPDHYKGLTLDTIQSQKYLVAYDITTDGGTTWTGFSDADKQTTPVISTVRIYRNYDDGSTNWYNRVTNVKGITVTGAESSDTVVFNVCPADGTAGNLPMAGIRSIWMDDADGLWVSTYGGGVAYKAANAETFTIYNKASSPALATAVVSAVAVDTDGGVWMAQNASYTDPSGNQGLAYMKDGQITYYKQIDDPKTIPNNYVQEIQIDKDGNVWFGSFGGLTKYNPTTKTWTTWDQTYSDSDGDRFPAMSIDNLIFDGQGGIWMGFYPTGAGTETDPFVGGFAHMTTDGNITPYKFTADYDATLGSSLLAQVWVRDIAVDKNGGVWVVASGSLSTLENVGGTIWHVDAQGQVTKYTGDQLLGAGKLTGNSEVRMVTVDPDGGLWFGSSADGLFYIANPGTEAPFTVTAQYNGNNGAWPESSGWNNIYSLDFVGKTLYAGSSAGLAYHTFDFKNDGNSGGGEVPSDYALTINGNGASRIANFTVAQLQNADKVTASYNWLNSFGTTGTDTFEGIYLEDLLKNEVGLTSNARSITVTASDGYYRNFNLDSNQLGIYWTDIQGHKIMLAWKQNGSPCDLNLVVGQTDQAHVNKPMWVSDVTSITVNTSSTSSGSGTPGNYKPTEPVAGTPEVSVTPTVSGGTATSSISVADVNKALESIQKTQNTGNTAPHAVVEINAVSTAPGGAINRTQVTLPADTISALVKETNVTAAINTDLGEIVLPPQVLKELASGSTQPIVISMAVSNETNLNDGAKEQIGGRPIINITITNGSQEITNLGGNQIRAGISYDAKSTESQNQLLVYYINDKGKSTPVKLSGFDGENKQMLFGTVHLSLYAVGYNEVSFADIQSHWAKNNIEFLAAREILKGKAADVFDPEGSVTRAEFVTMLANSMDGINVTGTKSAGYKDVAAGAWYTDYVNWAVASGITSGYGDGKFGPNDKITREQMAVMTDNFIKAVKADLSNVNEKSSFTDQTKINSWSAAAVTTMQQFGIINGKPDGTFVPQGTSTRAEAATVIKGYIDALLK